MKASLAFAWKGGWSGRRDFVLLRRRLVQRRSRVALLMQRMRWILRNKRQTNKQASILSSLNILMPVCSNQSGFIAGMKVMKVVPWEDFLHMQASLGICSLTRTSASFGHATPEINPLPIAVPRVCLITFWLVFQVNS